MLSTNLKLFSFIKQLNWHYKQKHLSFIFPRQDIIILFADFLLREGLIFSYSLNLKKDRIVVFLKYVNNCPALTEIFPYPRLSWDVFVPHSRLSKIISDRPQQRNTIVLFTWSGFFLLHDAPLKFGGWLICEFLI